VDDVVRQGGANRLGVVRSTLYRRIKALGLAPDDDTR
jgi:transcriptional regulator of acetoin/glycerol metabolism